MSESVAVVVGIFTALFLVAAIVSVGTIFDPCRCDKSVGFLLVTGFWLGLVGVPDETIRLLLDLDER